MNIPDELGVRLLLAIEGECHGGAYPERCELCKAYVDLDAIVHPKTESETA